MTISEAPGRVIDEPAFLASEDASLAAVWSRPAGARGEYGVVVLSAGGHVVHSQSNRWGFRLARALAAEGLPVLRFDYAGTGDSSGVAQTFALDEPSVADARTAVAAMAAEAGDVLLIGHCYGARAAFEIAAEDASVAGVYAIGCPVRDGARGEGTGNRMAYDASLARYFAHAAKAIRFSDLRRPEGRRRYLRLARTFVTARWRRLRQHLPGGAEDPTPWVSDRLISQLQALERRRTPVVFSYGSEDADYADFSNARDGRFGGLVTTSKNVEVSLRDGEVHNMARVTVQNVMVDEMVRWVLTRAEGRRSTRGRGR